MSLPHFAIAGLGVTPMGRIYGRSSTSFAVEAVNLAAADAGLTIDQIDGVLFNSPGSLHMGLQRALGVHDLGLYAEIQGYGSSAGSMVQYAGMAVSSGMATAVA